MDRRRPAAVIGSLCLAVAIVGGPATAVAQAEVGPGPRIEVTDLPVLSELPPLPAKGDPADSGEDAESSNVEMSGMEILALALAGSVLVAGVLGLALVTRRGRGEHGAGRGGHGAGRGEHAAGRGGHAAGRGERPDHSGPTPAR